MRPSDTQAYTRQTNFDGKVTTLSMDVNAVEHLLSVLTEMYSDPELAVIREYSTNAGDSHKAAGNTAPIKVTLPAAFKREFAVEDFGVGLSAQELDEIYSKYGRSTKRETNDETGMLGLGCKSALAYTSGFTLRCRKNGLETNVSVTRNERGVGQIEFLSTDAPTSEPDGVLVRVPVAEVHSFNEKAMRFFGFWPEGTVLVNDEPPVRRQTDSFNLSDSITMYIDDRYAATDTLVMGNVPYPIQYDRTDDSRPRYGDYRFVAQVPIGSIDFTPNREELLYTRRTKEYISKVVKEVKADVAKRVAEEIEAAEDGQAAIDTAIKMAQLVTGDKYGSINGHFTYRGQPIPTSITAPPQSLLFDPEGYGRSKTVELRDDVNIGVANASYYSGAIPDVIVKDFPFDVLTPSKRRKLAVFKDQNGFGKRVLLTVADSFESMWLPEIPTFTWEEVASSVKTARSVKNNDVKYTVWKSDAGARNRALCSELSLDELSGVDVIYYSNTQVKDAAWSARSAEEQPYKILNIDPTVTLVCLGKNSWAKFEREHDAGFMHVDDWLKARVDEFFAGLTNAEHSLLRSNQRTDRTLMQMAKLNIADPDLAETIKVMADTTTMQGLVEIYADLTQAAAWLGSKDVLNVNVPESPLDRYPLLRYTDLVETALEYVNSVYMYREASSQEEE